MSRGQVELLSVGTGMVGRLATELLYAWDERGGAEERAAQLMEAAASTLKARRSACLWDFPKDLDCEICFLEKLCDAYNSRRETE
jgi:hypothetical protein